MENINKLENLINEAMRINEMSMAWDYRKKNKAYCGWTEGQMNAENRYFKFYNSDSPDQATKVARIRLDRCEYVGGEHKEYNSCGKIEKWILTPKEKQLLVLLLKSPSDDNDGCTKWQDMLIRWNRDNFSIPAKKTISGEIHGYQAKPGLLDNIQPFDINTPMPNYLEL